MMIVFLCQLTGGTNTQNFIQKGSHLKQTNKQTNKNVTYTSPNRMIFLLLMNYIHDHEI